MGVKRDRYKDVVPMRQEGRRKGSYRDRPGSVSLHQSRRGNNAKADDLARGALYHRGQLVRQWQGGGSRQGAQLSDAWLVEDYTSHALDHLIQQVAEPFACWENLQSVRLAERAPKEGKQSSEQQPRLDKRRDPGPRLQYDYSRCQCSAVKTELIDMPSYPCRNFRRRALGGTGGR